MVVRKLWYYINNRDFYEVMKVYKVKVKENINGFKL